MTTTDLLADRLLTVKQVAEILSIGKSTVWLKCKNGTLPKPVKLGCGTRWRMSEIQAYIRDE